MWAVVATAPGPPDVLALREMEPPDRPDGGVLIDVEACGVCGHDLLNRAGVFPQTTFPIVLGHEIAGRVVSCDEGSGFHPGDRVVSIQNQPCGRCGECRSRHENRCQSGAGFLGGDTPGGYAEQTVCTEPALVGVPEELDAVRASVVACGIGTALHALRRGGVQAGDTVLVTGAGGGVGIHAVQLGAHLGARVIAVTTSPRKARAIEEAGAQEVVVVAGSGFSTTVRKRTGGAGVDVVVETTGSPTFGDSMRSVASGGTVVLVGNVTGDDLRVKAGRAILKEVSIVAALGCTPAELAESLQLVSAGDVTPTIGDVIPLAEAARAHRLLEDRQVTGRVVLVL